MKKHIFGLGVLAACLITPIANAGSSGYAVGLRAGVLLGFGIEGSTAIIDDRLNLRAGFNFGDIEFNDLELEDDSTATSGLSVDAEFQFGSAQVLADFFPFGGAFRLTGGLLSNDTAVAGSAVCESVSGCQVEGETFANGDRADLEVSWDGIVPYVGIGFGNPVSGDKGLGFMFDLGLALQGSPDTRFSASGSLSCNASCERNIERELAEETEEFDILPVLSFGINYQF